MIRSYDLDLSFKLILSFSFIHLKPIGNFILRFEKIGVIEFGMIINECHKVSSIASGENSVRVTHITMNQFEGFKIPYDRVKMCSNMFSLNTYFTFRS